MTTHATVSATDALADVFDGAMVCVGGFGPIKTRNLQIAKADEAALLEQFRSGSPTMLKAAE